MFVICDSKNVVQDVASEKENLSRGYKYANYKLYEKAPDLDFQVGDKFDGTTFTPNATLRQKLLDNAIIQENIIAMQKTLAIRALKTQGDLPNDYPET